VSRRSCRLPKTRIPWLTIAVIAFASLVTACETDHPENPPSSAPDTRRIIGGEETSGETKWRGVVALVTDSGLCTGTLIHPRVVLTAAHCLKLNTKQGSYDHTANPGDIGIWTGASTDPSEGKILSRADSIRVHPSWKGNGAEGDIDLALVYLSDAALSMRYFRLGDFPGPKTGQAATIVGYGMDTDRNLGTQRIGHTTIQTVNEQFVTIQGDSTICLGDSGGPVFVEEAGDWRIVGVNSFGLGQTCSPQLEMYAVNVLVAYDWLTTELEELMAEDLVSLFGDSGSSGCQTMAGSKQYRMGPQSGNQRLVALFWRLFFSICSNGNRLVPGKFRVPFS